MAFESGDGTMEWYLDRQTGEVIGLGDDIGFGEDEDEDDAEAGWQADARALRRAIYADENDERYLEIPSLGSHESFRIMERFAASQDGRVREALLDALDRRPAVSLVQGCADGLSRGPRALVRVRRGTAAGGGIGLAPSRGDRR